MNKVAYELGYKLAMAKIDPKHMQYIKETIESMVNKAVNKGRDAASGASNYARKTTGDFAEGLGGLRDEARSFGMANEGVRDPRKLIFPGGANIKNDLRKMAPAMGIGALGAGALGAGGYGAYEGLREPTLEEKVRTLLGV